MHGPVWPAPLWPAMAALLAGGMLFAQAPSNIESRVEALLARMTLEEKLGQMSQSTSMRTPLSDDIKTEIRAGRWGSFLNAGSPAHRDAGNPARHSSPIWPRRNSRLQDHLSDSLGPGCQLGSGIDRGRSAAGGTRSLRRRDPLDVRTHDRYCAGPAVGTRGGEPWRRPVSGQ